jgi:TPR repeat protein
VKQVTTPNPGRTTPAHDVICLATVGRGNAFDYSRDLVARFCVLLAVVSTCSPLIAQPEEDPRAQYNRGTEYWYGNGVPQDYVEAAKWFRKSAERGFAEAQFRLAQMTAIGQGIPQDNTEAAKWYRKAAEQGIAGAQFNLGTMYVFGQGVQKDYAQAAKWFRKAADQG